MMVFLIYFENDRTIQRSGAFSKKKNGIFERRYFQGKRHFPFECAPNAVERIESVVGGIGLV
ncbi:hypothetical protein CRP01_10850 [Flavilitoribacter nigricans DSM 23189 = NBRC 102662]|uniref:Uncharacterized protein n=1 Tax=Flavilitoribacter nigricans (strain ATCC 23147 / DSM 23189 / NBRC 102662 / NCIMB 1420 / SS-2) TaxID=1122177 RepID=A0A2D0NEH4_FLAN2|nr:hypothetical protein CRP01_10850 [Flavilitoribacter nigricans DSM 23189 = NBRC 102662]